MPYHYSVPILDQAPLISRPLRLPDNNKIKKYIDLANLLTRRFPTDSSGRAVDFLLELVTNQTPGPLPDLPWFTRATPADQIRIGLPSAIARVAPAMRFEARLGR